MNPGQKEHLLADHPLTQHLVHVLDLPGSSLFREWMQTDPFTSIHALAAGYFLQRVVDQPEVAPYIPPDEKNFYVHAITFHDIGKAGIAPTMQESNVIAHMPGSHPARQVARTHTWVGGHVLLSSENLFGPDFADLADVAFGHHEAEYNADRKKRNNVYPRHIPRTQESPRALRARILTQLLERSEACIGLGRNRTGSDPKKHLQEMYTNLHPSLLPPWILAKAWDLTPEKAKTLRAALVGAVYAETKKIVEKYPAFYDQSLLEYWKGQFPPDEYLKNWVLPATITRVQSEHADRLNA